MRITSPDNPRIRRVIRLRKPRERRGAGLFIAEGWREISRAAAAGLAVREVFLCPELTGPQPAQDLPPGAAVFELPANLLAKIAYRENPEGAVAVVEQPRWELEELGEVKLQAPGPGLQNAESGGREGQARRPAGQHAIPNPQSEITNPQSPSPNAASPLYLVAVGSTKPGNLGAMARTAAAAGAAAVLAADAAVDPFNPNAIRASTGAVFELPVVAASSGRIIDWLRQRGIRIAAATPEGAVLHTQAELAGSVAIVIGAEDAGLPAAWRAAANQLLRIPMHGGVVDSLNASATAAILLYEAVRQRLPAAPPPPANAVQQEKSAPEGG